MKHYLWLAVLMLASSAASSAAPAEVAAMSVRVETLALGELATGRPSTIDVWFPQGECAELQAEQWCLADDAVTDKVLVFSHGAMGSARDYRWVGEKLAAAGFVVVGVNHHGESRVYEPGSVDPRSTVLIWQRAEDVSALLDTLATRNIFQETVEWSNVVAIGHSAGGQTAAMLAGATFDLQQLIDYCDSELSAGDLACNYGRNRASAPEAFRNQFRAAQADARISMMVLLDPALGPAAQTQSLHRITIPTLVVGASNNDFLPWGQNGARYATEIPDAKLRLLTGQEGHFVFLSVCQHDVQVMGVPLCEDRPGVDREATHQALADAVIEFVRAHDEVFEAPVATNATAKQYSSSLRLTEILRYTPRWVFALLAGLVIFGVLQARTRQVSLPVALVLPVAMLLLSLTGVVRYVGWQWPALSCWLVGMASVAGLTVALPNKDIARFDSASRKLRIQGSWWPLLVILGIFLTRYALGVATAMDFGVIHRPYFQEMVSLLLGAWSGYFVARGVIFWHAREWARACPP